VPAWRQTAVIGGGHTDVGVRWIFRGAVQESGVVGFGAWGQSNTGGLELGAVGVFRFARSAVVRDLVGKQ
jgi:hypothetical protein